MKNELETTSHSGGDGETRAESGSARSWRKDERKKGAGPTSLGMLHLCHNTPLSHFGFSDRAEARVLLSFVHMHVEASWPEAVCRKRVAERMRRRGASASSIPLLGAKDSVGVRVLIETPVGTYQFLLLLRRDVDLVRAHGLAANMTALASQCEGHQNTWLVVLLYGRCTAEGFDHLERHGRQVARSTVNVAGPFQLKALGG